MKRATPALPAPASRKRARALGARTPITNRAPPNHSRTDAALCTPRPHKVLGHNTPGSTAQSGRLVDVGVPGAHPAAAVSEARRPVVEPARTGPAARALYTCGQVAGAGSTVLQRRSLATPAICRLPVAPALPGKAAMLREYLA